MSGRSNAGLLGSGLEGLLWIVLSAGPGQGKSPSLIAVAAAAVLLQGSMDQQPPLSRLATT